MPESTELIIFTDSIGAENFLDHPTSHGRTKHVEINRKWIKEKLADYNIRIQRADTNNMIADIMTKGLSRERHASLTHQMMNLSEREASILKR